MRRDLSHTSSAECVESWLTHPWLFLSRLLEMLLLKIVILQVTLFRFPSAKLYWDVRNKLECPKQGQPGWCYWAGLYVLCFLLHIRLPLLNVQSHSICHLVIFNQAVYFQKWSDLESDIPYPRTRPFLSSSLLCMLDGSILWNMWTQSNLIFSISSTLLKIKAGIPSTLVYVPVANRRNSKVFPLNRLFWHTGASLWQHSLSQSDGHRVD